MYLQSIGCKNCVKILEVEDVLEVFTFTLNIRSCGLLRDNFVKLYLFIGEAACEVLLAGLVLSALVDFYSSR